MELNVSIAY